jgi:hypothetical protein
MPHVQTKTVRFKVARAVELEPGLVLPPGSYIGTTGPKISNVRCCPKADKHWCGCIVR